MKVPQGPIPPPKHPNLPRPLPKKRAGPASAPLPGRAPSRAMAKQMREVAVSDATPVKKTATMSSAASAAPPARPAVAKKTKTLPPSAVRDMAWRR